jgi:hypothetical protein
VEYSVNVTIKDSFSGLQAWSTQSFTIPELPVPFVSLGASQRPIVANQPNTVAATASHRTRAPQLTLTRALAAAHA